MRFRTMVVALSVCTALGSQAVLAQTAGSAKRFLQTVYAAYGHDGNPPALDAGGKNALASASLQRLIRRNRQLLKGEAGYLDMDPICQCQDFDVAATAVDVEMVGRDNARGTVSFTNFGKPQNVRFDLVWANGGWHVDDIRSHEDPRGLREALKAEIADIGR